MLKFNIFLGDTIVRHYQRPSSVSRYVKAFADLKGVEIVAFLYGVEQGRYSPREWLEDDLQTFYQDVCEAERIARKQGHIDCANDSFARMKRKNDND